MPILPNLSSLEEPPPTERLTGEKKLITGWGGGGGGGGVRERSSITGIYFREHLFVKNICVYCKKQELSIFFMSLEGYFAFFFYFKISKFLCIYPTISCGMPNDVIFV